MESYTISNIEEIEDYFSNDAEKTSWLNDLIDRLRNNIELEIEIDHEEKIARYNIAVPGVDDALEADDYNGVLSWLIENGEIEAESYKEVKQNFKDDAYCEYQESVEKAKEEAKRMGEEYDEASEVWEYSDNDFENALYNTYHTEETEQGLVCWGGDHTFIIADWFQLSPTQKVGVYHINTRRANGFLDVSTLAHPEGRRLQPSNEREFLEDMV